MKIRKITNGYVDQTFDIKGNLISQEFVAGDDCDWENGDGDMLDEVIDEHGNDVDFRKFYHPFDMEQ